MVEVPEMVTINVCSLTFEAKTAKDVKASVSPYVAFRRPAVDYPLLSEISSLGLSQTLTRLLTVLCEGVVAYNLCVQDSGMLKTFYGRKEAAFRRNLNSLEELGYVKVHIPPTKHDNEYVVQIAPWYAWSGLYGSRETETKRWLMTKIKN